MTQQETLDQIVGQIKNDILMMLNATADEFDAMELTDPQREIYNKFTGVFGQKVLAIRYKAGK